MEKISFKNFSIEEAIEVEMQSRCCKIAFLAGMLKTVGSIEISKRGAMAVFVVEESALATKLQGLMKELYFLDVDINTSKFTSGFKKGKTNFELKVPKGQTKQLFVDTKAMDVDGETYLGFNSLIPNKIVENLCCAKTLLRSLFIGAGSIYVPSILDEEKADGYHFEIQLADEELAKNVQELMKSLGIDCKTGERGTNFIVYVKDSKTIVSALQIMSMHESAMKLETIIEERELSAKINRNVICEASNLDKTYTASANHLKAIQIIEDEIGFDKLPLQMKETAQMRKNNPQMSLQQLSEIMGISKSCLNHRMRKLVQISEEIGKTRR